MDMQTAPPLPPKTRVGSSILTQATATLECNPSHVVTIRIRDEQIKAPAPSYYYCGPYQNAVLSSGQCSPSDTFDSGTCSDLDATPAPSVPRRDVLCQTKSAAAVSVTVIGSPARSEDDDSNLSCDSLSSENSMPPQVGFPHGLLQDIRGRTARLTANTSRTALKHPPSTNNTSHQDTEQVTTPTARYEADRFYTFHLNESQVDDHEQSPAPERDELQECFAGYRDLPSEDAHANASSVTIRSARGTVRGVKNRVRAGIATFLMAGSGNGVNNGRLDPSKDAGRVVLYCTSMGIIRQTHHQCSMVRQILRTLLVKYEERDLFMASHYREELCSRLGLADARLPQLFVDGRHIGGADAVERLNESGELRRLLRPYRTTPDQLTPCRACGGYRLLPCPVCNGSKKSVHRNHFTAEFVALKCMNCDEVGLVKCHAC